MNIIKLISEFRLYTGDKSEPYMWEDDDATLFLNEGERECCIRGRLIFEKTRTDICNISVKIGKVTYDLNALLVEITYAKLVPTSGADDIELEVISRKELDIAYPGWRVMTGAPFALVHDDKSVEIIPAVSEGYTLKMETYRLPLYDMRCSSSDVPEIAAEHHKYIVKWALHRAYLVNDSDKHAEAMSMRYEKEFQDRYWIEQRSGTKKRQNLDKKNHEELFV